MDVVGEWMCGRVYGRMVGWMDDWMHGWLNVCVGCLLIVDLLGLWRGVKPVSLSAGGLWRGFISRKPLLLLTVNQHTHTLTKPRIQSSFQSSVRSLTTWVGGGMW